jgi:DNA-binding MarR family transcriptional regulator
MTGRDAIVRFDERFFRPQNRAMDEELLAVLRAYPQIYLACHVEHRTRGSSASGLTSRDSSLLAHVDEPDGSSPAALARHLGVAPSTLSAALARLEGQGLLTLDPHAADARRRRVRLTEAGREALAAGSVLDPQRLAAVLALMRPQARRRAVEGLTALAAAARKFREGGD